MFNCQGTTAYFSFNKWLEILPDNWIEVVRESVEVTEFIFGSVIICRHCDVSVDVNSVGVESMGAIRRYHWQLGMILGGKSAAQRKPETNLIVLLLKQAMISLLEMAEI